MSDQSMPTVYDGKESEPLLLDDTVNPFIIEAQLCDGKTSYGVKYVDGHYMVSQYDITDITKASEKCTSHTFLAHRMENRRLKFYQLWDKMVDELCEKMTTLVPSAFIFVGFDKEGGEA